MKLGIVELIVLLYINGNPGVTQKELKLLLKIPLGITDERYFDLILGMFSLHGFVKSYNDNGKERWQRTYKGLKKVWEHPFLKGINHWEECSNFVNGRILPDSPKGQALSKDYEFLSLKSAKELYS